MGVKELSDEIGYTEHELYEIINEFTWDCGDNTWYINSIMESFYDETMDTIYKSLTNKNIQYRLMDKLFDQNTIKDYVWENHYDWVKEVGRDEGDYY